MSTQDDFIDLSRIQGFKELPEETQDFFRKACEQTNTKLKQLFIKSSQTILFYSNYTFNSKSIGQMLNFFDDVSIELTYPSQNFDSIYQVISNLKGKEVQKMKIIIIVSDTKEIGDRFQYNDKINSVIIQPSVKILSDYSFFTCTSLAQVMIPASVTRIGPHAFDKCSSLTQVLFELPSSITSIGGHAFSECTSLTKIAIPDSVTSISESIFFGCSSLVEVQLPKTLTSIGPK